LPGSDRVFLMMKQLAIVFLFWGIFNGHSPAQENLPTRIEWEKPFRHKQTGIIFPKEIGAYQIVEKARYGKSSFEGNDVSVRYIDGDVKIDVYFYNAGQEKLEDDENHKTIINVIKGTLNYIKQSEGKIYNEVDIPDKMNVTDFGGDKFSMVRAVMQYREANKDPESDKKWKKKQESTMALTIYSNFFVKIRHSFLIPNDKKELEAERKKRDEFQRLVCSFIAEAEEEKKRTR